MPEAILTLDRLLDPANVERFPIARIEVVRVSIMLMRRLPEDVVPD